MVLSCLLILKSLHAGEGKVEGYFSLNQMKFSFWGPCSLSPHSSVLPSASHLGSVIEYKLGKKNKTTCSVLLLKFISSGLYWST